MSYLNDVDELSAEHVDFRINILSEELKALKKFKLSFPGSSDEWHALAVFLKENQLRKYAYDQAKKQLNMNVWPLEFINWDRVVEDIKEKLKTVVLGDIKYWVVKEPDVSSMSITDVKGFPIGDEFVEIEFGDLEYTLVQDDDCHWYVIPYEKLSEWAIWAAGDCPVLPDWATSVGGGPSLVLFKEYRIL